MKNILPAFIIMCLFSSCTNRIYYSSTWQSNKVKVDGVIPEWSNPLRFYDDKTGINYTISNNHQNLYLCCSISDEFLQTKILRSGLEFGIDTLGKKSFAVAIKYPIGNKSNTEPNANINPQTKADHNKRPDRFSFKLKLIAEAREMELVGFKPHLAKIISLSVPNNTGISAAVSIDKMGIMNYEAVIPFSTFYKNELTPSDSNIVFNYQIKVNPIPKSKNSTNSDGGMRSGGTRGGRMRSGGMRGGGMGGGEGMRGGGMGGGGMHGGGMYGMNSSDNYGEYGGNSYQRNTNMAGTTKTTIKLKLAYR